MRWCAILILSLILACGDDDGGGPADAPGSVVYDAAVPVADGPPDAPLNTPGCTVTLTGDDTGTFDCAVTAGKNDADSFSVLSLSAGDGVSSVLNYLAQIDGTLAVGSHLQDLASAAVTVQIGSELYVATLGDDMDIGTVGTLNITSLTPVSTGGGATVWAPHGTLNAMLVSTTTSGNRATLSASF